MQGTRLVAERTLAAAAATKPVNSDELRALVNELGGITDVLAGADPNDKSSRLRRLRIRLTYRPAERLVAVEAAPWSKVRVGGGAGGATHDLTPRVRLRRGVSLAR